MFDVIEKLAPNLKFNKDNWEPVKFGDVAIQQKETVDRDLSTLAKYIKGEHMGSEDIHIREWGELTNEYLGPAFIRRFRTGDILYGSRRTYLRKVAVAHFDGITSNTTFVIKANEKKIDKMLLPFVMLSEKFTEHSVRNSKGSVNPYVNWKDLADFKFLLPPVSEQVFLVDLLLAKDDLIEKETYMLKKIRELKQIVFLNRNINMEGKQRNLSEILIPLTRKKNAPFTIEKYIGLENIEPGNHNCTSFSDSSNVIAQCNYIKKGDLCYSKLRPYLDKAFIANFDAVSTTELLIFDSKKCSKKYILYHLHSKPFLDFVTGKVFGSKMPRVSNSIIGQYQVKVLKDERKLLDELQVIEESENQLKAKILNLKILQKALINQIFG